VQRLVQRRAVADGVEFTPITPRSFVADAGYIGLTKSRVIPVPGITGRRASVKRADTPPLSTGPSVKTYTKSYSSPKRS
jgi:hypothetical protein